MIDNTKQINQDMFRYNLVKDRYNIELEQLKDIDNASRMLYNTSIAVLTIEITFKRIHYSKHAKNKRN